MHLYNPQPSALTLNRVWLETPGEREVDELRRNRPRRQRCPREQAVDQRIQHESAGRRCSRRGLTSRGRTTSSPTTTFSIERYRNLSLAPYPLAALGRVQLRGRGGAHRTSGADGAAGDRAGRGAQSADGDAGGFCAHRAAGRHHAAGQEIFCAFGAGAQRSGGRLEGDGEAATAGGLARGAGHRAIFPGAGGRGAKRGLPGVSRSAGGKALHGDGGGGVRRPGISRGIYHHRISGAASLQSYICRRRTGLRA